MRNLLDELQATHHITCDEFEQVLQELLALDKKSKLDWDRGCGEEWARIVNSKYGVICIAHTKLNIAFFKRKYVKKIPSSILSKFQAVITEGYDEEEWYADLEVLKDDFPEIFWHTTEAAVNSKQFCLNDLYYATV